MNLVHCPWFKKIPGQKRRIQISPKEYEDFIMRKTDMPFFSEIKRRTFSVTFKNYRKVRGREPQCIEISKWEKCPKFFWQRPMGSRAPGWPALP